MTDWHDRLTLVTVFDGSGIHRHVSAYADVVARTGLTYDHPIAFQEDEATTVCIKPFTKATPDEVAALS